MKRPYEVLSPRRRQVLLLLSKGLTRPQIASELGLSPLTVNRHVELARQQLQARSTEHAVRLCFERRIFTLPEVRAS